MTKPLSDTQTQILLAPAQHEARLATPPTSLPAVARRCQVGEVGAKEHPGWRSPHTDGAVPVTPRQALIVALRTSRCWSAVMRCRRSWKWLWIREWMEKNR
jgi:hypothetical protein